jgi:hypothetical protein
MKHDFKLDPIPEKLGRFIRCVGCKDPEPDTASHVWRDADGTVYFDSDSPEMLIQFLAAHDAFRMAGVDV